ncbi:MAG TPA: ECF-type sigma factor [Pirellulales bacterium]|jgi:DNA-directed RNA polymerase specialized sigma24 family protein|nr:ECF-type sigma factor [Pirellulales bacterium]
MAPGDSITPWLSLLRDGHPEAAQRIWDRYFARLMGLARKKLGGRRLGIADEEDVAISALNSFCRNAREGRFPQLADSDGLWRLLIVITARKALHLLRDQGRHKRGGRAPTGSADSPDRQQAIDQLVGNEPTPGFAAQVAEQYEGLLGLLDADQRTIAIAKLEGLTNAEIAKRMNRALRTIERKLQLIRAVWEHAELS